MQKSQFNWERSFSQVTNFLGIGFWSTIFQSNRQKANLRWQRNYPHQSLSSLPGLVLNLSKNFQRLRNLFKNRRCYCLVNLRHIFLEYDSNRLTMSSICVNVNICSVGKPRLSVQSHWQQSARRWRSSLCSPWTPWTAWQPAWRHPGKLNISTSLISNFLFSELFWRIEHQHPFKLVIFKVQG